MGNKKSRMTKTEEGQVITVDFLLAKQPILVQLTTHINNLIITYGGNVITPTFRYYLDDPTRMQSDASGRTIQNIINHYGVKSCKEWFTLIYGWDFKKKVS